jgi:hypothetical protein
MSDTAHASIMLASERNTPNFFDGFVRTRSVLNGRDGRLTTDFCVYDIQPLNRALANIVGHFRSTEADFLLYVDPEARWHPSTIERAVKVSAEADVLCVGMDTVEADLRAKGDRPESATALTAVESAPLAFTLIRRSTIETLCERNPDLAFDGYAGKHQAWDLFGLVARAGTFYGEQASFCLRCRDAGLTIRRMSEVRA